MQVTLSKLWALGLLASGTGCSVVDHLRAPPGVLRVDSGGLVEAARGVTDFSLHPSARVVRPMHGRTDQELREAADTSLAAVLGEKGYKLAPPGESSRTFAYAVGVSSELSDAELMEIFGMAAGLDLDREGTRAGLVLALLETETGKVLWRASASRPWDDKNLRPTSEVGTEIRATFTRMLADLPRRW